MIKIAVCDDDKFIGSQLEDILAGYANKNCMKIDIDLYYTGEGILEYLKLGNDYDLIYLDIELGMINGIEVGKQIRQTMKNHSMEIVYISGKDGYDRLLFDVQPLHFIDKPINPKVVIDDLMLALERTKKFEGFFKYQKGHEIYKIAINDIIYFESLNREVRIVSINKTDCFYGNLEHVIIGVSDYPFLQIHRSYLINYNHAAILRYSEVVMSNGEVLPISRQRRQEIRNMQMKEE